MLEPPEATPIDLLELSDRTRVSPRTIRYYIQQGLLPAPETRGPGAHYGPEHVDRLHLIKRLQREHLPLSEIRKRLEALRPDEIRRLLATPPEPPRDSAAEYVRRILDKGISAYASPAAPMSVSAAMFPRELAGTYPKPQRSQWERFTLAPDVELHVRRPVSREDNRRIERLIEAARGIFNEELP